MAVRRLTAASVLVLVLLLPSGMAWAESGEECDYNQVESVTLVQEYLDMSYSLVRVFKVVVKGGCVFYNGQTIAMDNKPRTALEAKLDIIRSGQGNLLRVRRGTQFAPEVLEQWRREGYDPRIEFASARGEDLSRQAPVRRTVEVLINGRRAGCEVQPQLRDSRVFLPFRCITEALGGQVQWNERERRVTATKGGRTAVLWVGRREMLVDSRRVALDVAPYIVAGRTLVPVRALSEALGAHVEWDGPNSRVLVEVE